MDKTLKPSFMEHFKEITDPRIMRQKQYKLSDMFFITLCAVICGCDSWVAIAKFGEMKRSWFEEYLELENGIPSQDTFGRVFSLIDPKEFQACFSSWIQAVVKHVVGDVIAVDGKCLRGSYDKKDDKAAIHMVSAWSTANQLVLGQVKVDEKSNEITALPELLERLDITRAIITADAMHTQTKTAKLIVKNGGDYVLALKGNQSTLHDDITLFFEQTPQSLLDTLHYDKTVDGDHGRIEEREVTVCNQIDWLGEHKFPHLASIIRVKSRRFCKERWSEEYRYYISSINKNDASLFNRYVRSHWGVENSLHWTLDMAFDEDHCRIREGYADENMSMFRHMSLNLLKAEKSAKVGIKIKRQMAGWDSDYLLKVLGEVVSS
jgi:predicted transposase YbfD/YdcC